MQAIDLPIKYHLSPADQARLKERAKAMGLSPGDFMETAIKRALFSDPVSAAEPSEAKPDQKEEAR